MFGFSVFMNEEMTQETVNYIKEMAQSGFKGIFTSMHIPEDDAARYRQRLTVLGEQAKKNHLDLMVDISGEALTRAGFSFTKIDELLQLGVTGLRMDYAISNQQIAQLSHQLKVALNASTISQKDIDELQTSGADFSNLEAWHNYYPRPETGLESEWFNEKNCWLKKAGFKVQAFVPGDSNFRGPLFSGLPTLEEHRGQHPLASTLALLATKAVDLVYIGDGGLTPQTKEQFEKFQNDNMILLHLADIGSDYYEYVLGSHENRRDEARDVVRSANARFQEIPLIKPQKTNTRVYGSVTVDNENYQRYMGEIQICKKDLPVDEKVNVAGRVISKDLPLIQQISAGMKFYLERDDEDGKNQFR